MKYYQILTFIVVWFAFLPANAAERSWHELPTGNGHSFQIFDRTQGKLTTFLEEPYRFVAPLNESRDGGVERRDLAHDIYFGIAINGESAWIDNVDTISYESQSHIIHGQTTFNDTPIDTYYYAPFGFNGNALVMLTRISNPGNEPINANIYSKPNLKLGVGRPNPGDAGETISVHDGIGYETGPGGGHVIYAPIGNTSSMNCGSDTNLYNQLLDSGEISGNSECQGASQVLVLGESATIPPGGEFWWGSAILFLNDNPSHEQASLFRHSGSTQTFLSEWNSYLNGRSAEEEHAHALAEMDAWRSTTAPEGLTPQEQALWRQSETTLRLGQIRNRAGENDGMMLAALPPGQWHIGWVRDGTYAISSFAMTGHTKEAKLGVEFLLGAGAGFYNTPYFDWADGYRISVCRYFGNGMEESDTNYAGPNIETDGWGLTLWAARMVIEYSCDLEWLNQRTWRGDSIFEALTTIARNIEDQISNNLPWPDNSIWETHWDKREIFSYTVATQLRGLYDFAHIADAAGSKELASHYRELADRMLEAAKQQLVYTPQQSLASHQGVADQDVHVDGSTLEFLHWGLIEATDPIFEGTLNQYQKLRTNQGGFRRLEPQLSLTGATGADTYDLSEWVFLNLRVGDIMRRVGREAEAETLLDKVTEEAAANDNLVPELYNPTTGDYDGAIPMVGYGAGAWMMSQLEKHGMAAPLVTRPLSHCAQSGENPISPETPETIEEKQPTEKTPKSLCFSTAKNGGSDYGVLLFLGLFWCWRRKKEKR